MILLPELIELNISLACRTDISPEMVLCFMRCQAPPNAEFPLPLSPLSNTFITFRCSSFPCTHPTATCHMLGRAYRTSKCLLPFATRYHKHVRQNAKKFLSNFAFVLLLRFPRSRRRRPPAHRLFAIVKMFPLVQYIEFGVVRCVGPSENCSKHTYAIASTHTAHTHTHTRAELTQVSSPKMKSSELNYTGKI